MRRAGVLLATTLAASSLARADTAAPAAAGVAAPAARALLDRWLAAQNKGDFATYAKLYAPQFHGVRRSGKRTVMLDRKGWLVDRGRMFQKPMQVSIADVKMDGSTIRLTQSFTQGTYKDVGQKELVLQSLGSELVIAREEMLSSDKSVNPGPLSYLDIRRDSGDGESDYAYLTTERCNSSGPPSGDVIVRAALKAPPAGAKVELTLASCDLVQSKPHLDDPPYMECSCEGENKSDSGSVTLPARDEVHHRFKLGPLPCGVVARARARVGGNVVGEMSAYASAGSCPE
jgi:hypothetical protein